ncbi:MAG: glycosyltransferase [Candidatus Sericytochromatia bacterium]
MRRVALVHDWLTDYGGAERVLLEMHALYPQAPVYTSLWKPETLPPEFASVQIVPSFLQRLPARLRRHRLLLPLMPLAFEAFDLDDYELVLSSSHACAKGVLTGPQTLHVAYLHTPIRYAWDMFHSYVRQAGLSGWKQLLIHPLLHYLRLYDQLSSQRIDHLLCNSEFVSRRIRKYYRREATVIYPPVDVPTQPPQRRPKDFYLVVGRHVPYKRVDLAIETFRANGRRLKIVGDGPERARLQASASKNIEFLGEVPRPELEALYASARGLIFSPLEDFGIVPVEAQAHGCPVLAYGRGGACETVVAEETGLFFAEQSVASLQQALERFESLDFAPARLHAHAGKFAAARFRRQLQDYLAALLP